MAAGRSRLDRKARLAIALAATLTFLGPVLAVRHYLSTTQENNRLFASGHPINDGLVRLKNGSTVLLQGGSLAPKISAWLELDKNATASFEMADSNFVTGSEQPTRIGWTHIAQLAQILDADPNVRAEILFSDRERVDGPTNDLEQSRAARIYSELLAQHVPASTVSFGVQPRDASTPEVDDAGQQAGIFIVVSR